MTRRIALLTLAFASLPLALFSQQRDAPVKPVIGSGQITGLVQSDDSTPRPVRQVLVRLGGLANERSAITDDQGRFTFGRLPAGRYTITAQKAGHLSFSYGARRPGRPGTALSIAEGERASVTLSISRGAVATGAIHDANGQPLGGIPVAALDVRAGLGNDLLSSAEFVKTDDRGVYRIYGLMPGDYVIAAVPRVTGSGSIGLRSTAEMDALLADLAKRTGNRGASSSSPPPPLVTPPSMGFAATYFPGSPLSADATRVTLAIGEERAGLDFVVTPVPVARVSGTVAGTVPNLAAVRLSLIIEGQRLPPASGTSPVLSRPPDASGRFEFTNMAPGRYRITARGSRTQTAAPAPPTGISGGASGSGAGAPSAPAGEYLYAVVDVDVRGQDITGLALTLRPGSMFGGRVVLVATAGPAPADLTGLRVGVGPQGGSYMSQQGDTIIGNTFSSVPVVSVGADGRFEVGNIAPGEYLLRATLPDALSKSWWLASAMVGGRDLLDTGVEFEPGVNISGVTLTLTDAHTELSGSLRTVAGTAAPEHYVIVFPADRALWRTGSRRLKSTRPASDGRFSFTDLPPGDYLLAALTDLEGDEWQRAAFLEQVVPAAAKVTITPGGKTVQDLQIAR